MKRWWRFKRDVPSQIEVALREAAKQLFNSVVLVGMFCPKDSVFLYVLSERDSTVTSFRASKSDGVCQEPNVIIQHTMAGWFQIFYIFTPIWGRFPFWLSNIFQMGWNHQLDGFLEIFRVPSHIEKTRLSPLWWISTSNPDSRGFEGFQKKLRNLWRCEPIWGDATDINKCES